MVISETEKITIGRSDMHRLLELEQHLFWRRLNNELVEQVIDLFESWPHSAILDSEPERSRDGRIAQHIVQFMLYDVEQSLLKLQRMKQRYGEYSQRYSKAVSEQEKTAHIMEYAAELGADARQLRGDKKAFNRWFGHDALSDRYQRRYLEAERYLSFVLQCLGRMAALTLQQDGLIIGHLDLWNRLALEPVIKPLLTYAGDQRVVAAAFHSLTDALDVDAD